MKNNGISLDFQCRINKMAQFDFADQKSVHELFELQVVKTPNNVALTCDNLTMTYNELNHKSNQLARTIRNRYERHYHCEMPINILIGLCLGRSFEMVIGILAILKAGAAYVPLDSQYPQDRLKFMLEDTKAALVLTNKNEKSLSTLFSENENEKFIFIDNMVTKKEIQNCRSDNIGLSINSKSLAYVIYTSGSSGTPKGVLVTHDSIRNLVINSNYIEINESDCLAQLANTAFDAMTFELFGSLLNGAKLALFSKNEIIDLNAFSLKLKKQNVNVLFITTALFNIVVKQDPFILSNMKNVLFGGEKVNTECVNQYLEKTGSSNLIHVYGPTESTTFATYYPIKSCGPKLSNVPIGYPLRGVTLTVLDKNFNICPVGVTGELYIGGLGLAQGYLNRNSLNEKAFISNLFCQHNEMSTNNRLYKTGDLVKELPDGSFEYVNRIDNQVKIRGFRIELNEIQNILLKNEQILQAEVVVIDNNNENYIAAYFVTTMDKSQVELQDELSQYLQKTLPNYMIPSFFVKLDKIPLTPNGKVDKKSLPIPNFECTAKEGLQPKNETEKFITTLWREIFNIPKISVTDNFFKLGGHSLLAGWVISRINAQYALSLTIISIFKHPCVTDLSNYVLSLCQIKTVKQLNNSNGFSLEV